MSLVPVPMFPYPFVSPQKSRTSYNVSSTWGISNSAHRCAYIFRVPLEFNGATLTQIHWRTGNVTSSAALRIGAYTVSAGVPTTTQYGGSAYATRATVAAATAYIETLPTPATLTAGDQIAIVIEPDGTTPNLFLASNFDEVLNYPKAARYDGTTWTANAQPFALMLKTSDGYLTTYIVSPHGLNTSGFNVNSNTPPVGDENGLYIPLPFACRISGMWYHGSQSGGATYDGVLYDAAGTVLTSRTGLTDLDDGAASSNLLTILFANQITVSAGTVVRAILKATNTTNTNLFNFGISETGQEVAVGLPLGSRWTYRADNGPFTESTVRLPAMGLILDALDDGAAGGGGAGELYGFQTLDNGLIL